MSPLHIDRAVPMTDANEFDPWLEAHARAKPDVVIAIYEARSVKRTVALEALQEAALCHGWWVDTQNKRIDEERYAIRFVPRRVSLGGSLPAWATSTHTR